MAFIRIIGVPAEIQTEVKPVVNQARHAARHNTREHNPQTHMHIDRNYIFNNISNNTRQQFPRPKC
jgi:hypothetical protein